MIGKLKGDIMVLDENSIMMTGKKAKEYGL